jgi:hypothetical protein
MATFIGMNDTGRMNSTLRTFLLLVLLSLESMITFGCSSTAHGISKDYHRNEDKVENALH